MQPGERQAFVKQQCHDDVTLISQVYRLIKTEICKPVADQQLSDTDNKDNVGDDWQPAIPIIGTRIGPYQLTRLLGVGGMGAVFLAERIDSEFHQQVAIKLVHSTLMSMNIAARLRAERQILASLQHPNIAMLLDGGTVADGTPYLVMEYIDGLSVDVYCDRHQLTIEQRLRLFLKICSAVQCAHQNLIMHRDLKPTNILVNNEGQPKLLDFGIAKLLDTTLQQRHNNLTHHDMRMLTPAHASPEQILGETITTSSDIYVLGVLLYELLCGCRPFIFPKQYRLIDLEQIICCAKPLAPSVMLNHVEHESSDFVQDIARCRSMSTTRLKRVLKGDIDNIVMMAMRKEPARRYTSVEQLSNDIKNWLDELPVTATKDSWRYRAGKFSKRYALAIAALTVTFIGFVIFTIVLLQQFHKTSLQRDAIAVERNRAEQVSAFLLDLFRFSDPSHTHGNDLKARDLLDASAKRLDTALSSQPLLRATMLDTLGQVYGIMGLTEDAVTALEKALKTRVELEGENNAEVANVLSHLGDFRILQGENADAVSLLSRALRIQQNLPGDHAIEQANLLRLLADATLSQGNFAVSEEHVLQALALYDSHRQFNTLGKALALSTLGRLRANQYHDAEAEQLMRAALADMLPELGNEHPQVMDVKIDLADVLEVQGKYSEAQPLFEMVLEQKRRILGSEHPDTISSLEYYGTFLIQKGDYDQAQIVVHQALKANSKLYGDQHEFVGYDYVILGILYFMRGEYARSEQQYRQALTIYAKRLAPNNVFVAIAEMSLGRTLIREKKAEEAIAILKHALGSFKAIYGDDNQLTQRTCAILGIAFVAAHRDDEARPLLIAARPYIENTINRYDLLREFHDALDAIKH